MTGAQWHLTGQLEVPLPPDKAFRLFTPRGEEDWAIGWKPRFPVPANDDTAPGTVFETDNHGETTTWVVLDRVLGRRISYARVIPRHNAGTVMVTLDEVSGNSTVTVTYKLTALTEAANEPLNEFAERYPAFLRSWQDAIELSLTQPGSESPPRSPAETPGTPPPSTHCAGSI